MVYLRSHLRHIKLNNIKQLFNKSLQSEILTFNMFKHSIIFLIHGLLIVSSMYQLNININSNTQDLI